MGDGYTLSEKNRFFEDMRRLTDNMFTGDTFAQYLPLFNIWAAYAPSAESGIGVGGKAKDTAFQLYRDGTELRGVYTRKPQAARDLCRSVGTAACDFPSLIGNDDFYGGLGGEFVIATRSLSTGTIVLRHEMGHNFGDVGEEYDGGYVYVGANAAASLATITWKHWLSNPYDLREEKASLTHNEYMWYNLKDGPYTIPFKTTGEYKRWMGVFTISGADKNSSVSITLDGEPLAWSSRGNKDRSFYTYKSSTGFTAGTHTIVVTGNGPFDGAIIQQLCSFDLNEYGDESTFLMDNSDVIAAYPTWNQNNRKTYRPNNERCLMRNMESTQFCSVCQENMWHQFMARIEFIDAVEVTGSKASLKLIPLGQLRLPTDSFVKANPDVALKEKYLVKWVCDDTGEEVEAFRDLFEAELPAGNYTARVTFTTPNVRVDPSGYMQSETKFTVTQQSVSSESSASAPSTTVVACLVAGFLARLLA